MDELTQYDLLHHLEGDENLIEMMRTLGEAMNLKPQFFVGYSFSEAEVQYVRFDAWVTEDQPDAFYKDID
jgi:hypothetical protein